MQLRSVRSWIVSTRTMLRPTVPSPSVLLNLNSHNVVSKIHLKWARSSTITIDRNIQAVEQIGIRDRQNSVCRLPYELSIPTTTVDEIISNHLDMREVSIRWVRKLGDRSIRRTTIRRDQFVAINSSRSVRRTINSSQDNSSQINSSQKFSFLFCLSCSYFSVQLVSKNFFRSVLS